MRPLNGQIDPTVNDFAEILEVGDHGSDLFYAIGPDEPAGDPAPVSKGQLGVWAVRPGVFRIDAFAAWPATNTVLFGQAPRVYGTQGHQALFELSNLFVDLLNCACFFHIRYYRMHT